MRNVTQLKENKLAAVFEAQLKFVNFFYLEAKKCPNSPVLVFNEDSKMGSAIFVPIVSKKIL